MNKLYKLTHFHLFCLGWIYYLFIPIIFECIGMWDLDENFKMMGEYINSSDSSFFNFASFSFMMLFIYWVGSVMPSFCWDRRGGNITQHRRITFHKITSSIRFYSWLLLLAYGSMLIFFAMQAGPILGAGYIGSPDLSLIGPSSTLQMLILFQYLYERSDGNSLAGAFGFLLILNSIVLLSAGGRLYVLSALVAIYFRWWNWGALSKAAQLRSLAVMCIVPVALVLIGMWRLENFDFSLINFYATAEAIFTSISGITFFNGGQWSVLPDMLPIEFMAAFANIVPSMFWSDKAGWLESIASINKSFENPFGAVSIVASTVGNFGFLGGLIFILGISVYMSYVERVKSDTAHQAYYCYLVGLLPFMFFRDPLHVQIKVVMTGFIIYLVTKFLTRYFRRVRGQ